MGMGKSEDMLQDLTGIIESTEPKYIHSLDIEGAPRDTSQVSIVDGDEKSLFNTYCTGKIMSDGKKLAVSTLLKRTKILVGFGVESDITALAKQDVDISMNIVIVDLYFTIRALLEKGFINRNQLQKQDLQAVAEYYGIKNITGYHNSLVDATVAMKLFWAMYEKNHGYFWVMSNHKVKEIMESKGTENKEAEAAMESKLTMGIMDYSYETEDVIYKSSSNLYEALIMVGKKEQIIRMTKAEYDLYKKICKFAPGYPLRVFYLTVLAPGQMAAVRMFKEKLEAEKRAANDVVDAAFGSDDEENSILPESEEIESDETTAAESEAM